MKNTFLRVFLVVLLSNIVVVSIGLGMVQFIQKRNQVSADLLGDVGVQLVAGYEKFGITSLQEETKKRRRDCLVLFIYIKKMVGLFLSRCLVILGSRTPLV